MTRKKPVLYYLLLCLSLNLSAQEDFTLDEELFKEAITYQKYITQEGDSVGSIAEKYDISPEDIIVYNPDILPVQRELTEENEDFSSLKIMSNTALILPQYDPSYLLERQEDTLNSRPKILPESETDSLFINKYDSYQTHVVQYKETKYGISRQYDISIELLEQFNPQTVERFDKGMMLLIPNIKAQKEAAEESRIQDEQDINEIYAYHVILKQETLFGIASSYGISMDSLKVLNPELVNIIRPGDTIKVPISEDFLASKTLATDLPSHLLKPNIIADFEITKKKKRFALFLPFMLSKIDFEAEHPGKEILESNKLTQLSLSFYKGVMLAFNTVAKYDASLILDVFDTEASPEKLSKIIHEKTLKNHYTGVIGPVFNNQSVELIAKEMPRTPIFLPFANQVTYPSPYLIQTIPDETYIREQMTDFLELNSGDKQLLLIVDESTRKVKDFFLKRFPGIKIINSSKHEYLQTEIVSKLLSKQKENWVILETNRLGLITNTTSLLNALTANFDIQLITTNTYKAYDNNAISKIHLSNLKFIYPSIFFEKKPSSDKFRKAYEERFKTSPDKYAFRGFDIAFDMLIRTFSGNGKIINNLVPVYRDNYLATGFTYVLDGEHYKNQQFHMLSYSNLKIIQIDYQSH